MRIEDNFAAREVLFNNKFQQINNKKVEEREKSSNFANILKETIGQVNNQKLQADAATQAFVRGDDVSIDEVMIKGTEASLGLQFLTQVRDKLLEGYNELSKMQL